MHDEQKIALQDLPLRDAASAPRSHHPLHSRAFLLSLPKDLERHEEPGAQRSTKASLPEPS